MKKLKHIDVITRYFYPVEGGIEDSIKNLYSRLLLKGWDVTIHTSKDSYEKKDILTDEDIVEGLNVKRYSFGKLGFFPRIDWKNTNLICLHNFNLFPHFFILFYSFLLKISGRKKFNLVLTPHGGFTPNWQSFPQLVALIKKIYHYTCGAFLLNSVVGKIRALSEWEKLEITKSHIYEKMIDVIPDGLEDEAFKDVDKLSRSGIKEKARGLGRYLIQIGKIYPLKNYETVIRSLVYTPKDVKYLIVGSVKDKTYFKKLNKLAKKLKLEKRVVFAGVVRGIDKFYLLKNAKIMVHLSLYESYAKVVYEGISQGLVCIVSENTGPSILIKENKAGFSIPAKDYEKLAEKINFFLSKENSEEIKQMKMSNKTLVSENSWDNVSKRVNHLYNEK